MMVLPRARHRAVVAAARTTTHVATTCVAAWLAILATMVVIPWRHPPEKFGAISAVLGVDDGWLGGDSLVPTLELGRDTFTLRLGRRALVMGSHPASLERAPLRRLTARHRRVLLAPSDGVTLQRIAEAMDAVRSAGFEEVMFAPEP